MEDKYEGKTAWPTRTEEQRICYRPDDRSASKYANKSLSQHQQEAEIQKLKTENADPFAMVRFRWFLSRPYSRVVSLKLRKCVDRRVKRDREYISREIDAFPRGNL